MPPKADIQLILVVMTANDPKRSVTRSQDRASHSPNSQYGFH